jgi:DNA polymerase III subunit epsilon
MTARALQAGWYADPQDQSQLRWWDGAQWTNHTQPMPPVLPPMTTPPSPPPRLLTSSPREALALGQRLGVGGFVAIDFETATRRRSSACSVGIAAVEGGEVVDTQHWLICPPDNEYDAINISIHGITPTMTSGCSSFDEVWPEVEAVIGGRPLVAHWAQFDFSVLRRSMDEIGSAPPDLTYFCTVRLARHTWPGWLSYRLPDVANACGLSFPHHQADADAWAAAEIAVACCGAYCAASLKQLGDLTGVHGRSCLFGLSSMVPISHLSATVSHADESGELFGKVIAFTGSLDTMTRSEAAQMAVNAGATCATSVSKRVNYLVVGIQDARKVTDGEHSEKMLKAAGLAASGSSIELISEIDFLRMISD